jgi:hypothetical protein
MIQKFSISMEIENLSKKINHLVNMFNPDPPPSSQIVNVINPYYHHLHPVPNPEQDSHPVSNSDPVQVQVQVQVQPHSPQIPIIIEHPKPNIGLILFFTIIGAFFVLSYESIFDSVNYFLYSIIIMSCFGIYGILIGKRYVYVWYVLYAISMIPISLQQDDYSYYSYYFVLMSILSIRHYCFLPDYVTNSTILNILCNCKKRRS